MPITETINTAPEFVLAPDNAESHANQNLKNLSPFHIMMLTMLISHWQDSRNLISETNRQSPKILPKLAIGEMNEAEEARQNEGSNFDRVNYSKELADVLVFLQMMTEIIGDGYSINAILAAVDKKLVLANSSNVYDRTNEVIGDISLIKDKEAADKKAIFEVYTTILALYMSSPNLPDIVVSMYRTIRLNGLNYPREYFEVDSQQYENQELVAVYDYRKALCRVLRDEGLIGKGVDSATHRKNVLLFADIVLNDNLQLPLAMQLLKERIIRIKENGLREYKVLKPSEEGFSIAELEGATLVEAEKARVLKPTPAQIIKYGFIKNS